MFSKKLFLRVLKIFAGILVSLLLFVLAVFIFFNLSGPSPREDVALGMTFSYRYAEDLGLDWKETYLALLEDIGIKKMRIPVYWDLTEPERGEYDFSKIDWQLEEARKRNVEVILTVGQRVPRWPECHIPSWIGQDEQLKQQRLIHFMKITVERYRGNSAVKTWQVENEPFLPFFGNCPVLDPVFLDLEVAIVRQLDPTRPILLTDSGELSLWFQAAKRGDVFGTTLYRDIYKHGYGYFTYPVGPNFFLTKEFFTRLLSDQEHFIVIELQAEPWASGWVGEVPLGEQFITMNEKKLEENVTYAKRIGFPEIYLWGGEWWYWLKTKKDYPAVWEKARELYR